MKLGIDASNIGGGGGLTHLKEILENFDNEFFNGKISKLIVFSSQVVLDELPEMEILDKVSFPNFNQGLLKRVRFQLNGYDKEIEKRCDMLFSITGDYIGKFKPVVGMSRNMLLYERDIWKEIKQPKEIIRFWINFKKQEKCFKNAASVIFISKYAKDYISKKLDLKSKPTKLIHHGLSPKFEGYPRKQLEISEYNSTNPFRFLYVSTVHVYKKQWNVVKAISALRNLGYPVELSLVGGVIFEPAGRKLEKTIALEDPEHNFLHFKGHINYTEIEREYQNADGIIFASTCENMPNILMESMASGLPIACSDKQPMPEFLKTGGSYFNAKDPESVKNTLKIFLDNPKEREIQLKRNKKEIEKYSWTKTSRETFEYLLKFKLNH